MISQFFACESLLKWKLVIIADRIIAVFIRHVRKRALLKFVLIIGAFSATLTYVVPFTRKTRLGGTGLWRYCGGNQRGDGCNPEDINTRPIVL